MQLTRPRGVFTGCSAVLLAMALAACSDGEPPVDAASAASDACVRLDHSASEGSGFSNEDFEVHAQGMRAAADAAAAAAEADDAYQVLADGYEELATWSETHIVALEITPADAEDYGNLKVAVRSECERLGLATE